MSENQSLYSQYGLTRNPFPRQGSFPVDTIEEKNYALIFTGRDEVVRKIHEMINLFRSNASIPVIFLVGEYGYGKTHALKYIQYRIIDHYADILPFYIKNIGEPRPLALYKAILNAIYGALDKEFFYSCAEKILNERRLLMDFVTKTFPDFREIIQKLANRNIRALRWLFAEELTPEEKDALEVVRVISNDNADEALIALVRLIAYGSDKKLVFLIDELESVVGGYTLNDVRKFYEALRNIVDKLSSEAMFIFAAAPIVVTGDISIGELHPALLSRIQGDIIELNPLRKDEMKRLFEKYLTTFRDPKVRQSYERLYPFTEDSLDAIYEYSQGIPRRVLQIASVVLYEAAKRNLRVIDSSFIHRLMHRVERAEAEPEEAPLSSETEITISEILEERAIEQDQIIQELDRLERKMYQILKTSAERSATLSSLARKIYVTYDAAFEVAKSLERKGIVLVKRRGSGYRVILRV